MAMGGDGPWAIAVMWVMATLTGICVGLRLYVRSIVMANTGYDDHVYVIAFVSASTSSHPFTLPLRSEHYLTSVLPHSSRYYSWATQSVAP